MGLDAAAAVGVRPAPGVKAHHTQLRRQARIQVHNHLVLVEHRLREVLLDDAQVGIGPGAVLVNVGGSPGRWILIVARQIRV